MRTSLGGVSLRVPAGWAEMPDVGVDTPYTLARDDEHGVGALQFSFAVYSSGKRPHVTLEALLGMARQRARQVSDDVFDEAAGPGLVAAVSCRMKGHFVRIWYLSDGANIAFVTYTCGWRDRSKELQEVEAALRTLEFDGAGSRRRGRAGRRARRRS